jgi:uncharacterized sodium:solute symporter family permease YidK
MKLDLDTLFLFLFVLSCVYVLNSIVKLVVSVIQTPPKQLTYTVSEKICNYFFVTYFITYLTLNL